MTTLLIVIMAIGFTFINLSVYDLYKGRNQENSFATSVIIGLACIAFSVIALAYHHIK